MTLAQALVGIVVIVGFFAALAGFVIFAAAVLDDWIGR